MKTRKIVLSLLLIISINIVQAKEESAVILKNVNFDAEYYKAGSTGKFGVIVLGGSGGGKATDVAEKIAKLGYDVLSLAYFDRAGSEHIPETLELIPLEYFEEPKKWLMSRASTRNDGVILYGLSKGAELALVLASYDEDYKAVIAIAPSHVVWQGNPKNFSDLMSSPSSWSWQGEGLPFVPYISNEEKERLGLSNRHRASLTNKIAVEKAKIDVSKINSPVLLLSGGLDRTWPASDMSSEICSKINVLKPRNCTHINYKNGDHLISNFQSESFYEIKNFLEDLHQ